MNPPKVDEVAPVLSIQGTSLHGRRDAFHVPAVLVTSVHQISAGQSLKFVSGSVTEVELATPEDRQGVASPFLTASAKPDEGFWMFLTPGSVADLTHNFVINEVDKVEATSESPEPEEDDYDYDDGCAGCYGEEEDDDNPCAGCYS